MIYSEEVALKVAEFLLKKNAVKLRPDQPFQWASGWKSPIYCDNRKTLSFPEVRTYIRQQFQKAVEDRFIKPDCIAGVATGGIPHGVLLAQEFGVPFIYVRSAPKGHGMENLIEGEIPVNKNVLVVEDLVSTGGSSLNAVKALRDAGCDVKQMVSVFDYDFESKREQFKKEKCELVSLSDYEHVLRKAIELEYIDEKKLGILQEWRHSPSTWGIETTAS
jgi:orotate phosphoribosyltransferase